MGGGKGGGGGGGGGPGPQAERLAGITGNIAQSLFNETAGIRSGVIGNLTQELPLAGQPIELADLENSALFPAIKQGTEQQFDLARERILADTAPGGALTGALGQLESGRGAALAQGQGAIAEIENRRRQANLDRAIGVGTGGASQGLSGLSNAGSIFAGLQANQIDAARNQTSKGSNVGSFAGTIGSALIGLK